MSDLSDRIDFLLKKSKERRADLVRATGINESTIRCWYSNPKPSADALYLVAKHFGVTVEWLLTGEGIDTLNEQRQRLINAQLDFEKIKPPTFQEQKLLEVFRGLSEQNKNAVLLMAQSLIKTNQ